MPTHRRVIGPLSAALLLSLALPLAAAAAVRFAPADGCDFRHARWGMTVREVRNSEPGTPSLAEGNVVSWVKTVGRQPCTVTYLFHDDRLCMGIFRFSDVHEDLNLYFDDAESIKAELSGALGAPQIEKWHWADPVFESDRTLWAESLGFGLVQYELGWVGSRSLTAMRLSGGNEQGDLVILVSDLTCFAESRRAFAAYFERKVGLPSPYFR